MRAPSDPSLVIVMRDDLLVLLAFANSGLSFFLASLGRMMTGGVSVLRQLRRLADFPLEMS